MSKAFSNLKKRNRKMSEAFFVSKAFFENAFEKIKRFREKTIVLKNDTGSTPEHRVILRTDSHVKRYPEELP